jgi:RNA polymerase sigma-70 factor (sigma-E family)
VGEGALVAARLPVLSVPAVTDRRDDAVAALFDAHYASLCRLATLLLGDAGQAEEAVQEAFLRTFAGWRRLHDPGRAGAYLRAAVVNQCRSRGRRRSSEQRANRTHWAGSRDDDTSAVERTGDALAVLDAVRALPQRQREAVVLRYYADLSEAEVALALSCAVGTVKSQLAKARATLLLRLAEPGSEAAVEDAAATDAAVREAAVGEAAVGEAAVGEAAVGEAAATDTAVKEAAVEEAVVDE